MCAGGVEGDACAGVLRGMCALGVLRGCVCWGVEGDGACLWLCAEGVVGEVYIAMCVRWGC